MSLLMKMEGKVWKKGIRIDHSMLRKEALCGHLVAIGFSD
jgi:hypothetical protein